MITHEFKKIMEAYQKAASSGKKAVLATVVALDGSSYRRPGVRMLLIDDGTMVGAVSGGCVEKEVYRQALSVFEKGTPKVMTYDGRYRLGCEGILYVLLEPFDPSEAMIQSFWKTIEQRTPFEVHCYFKKEHSESDSFGSVFVNQQDTITIQKSYTIPEDLSVYKQTLPPCFQLVLIGGEHDAVQLCSMAALMGWEVTVVVNPKEEKTAADFPGVTHFIPSEPEGLQLVVDQQTAILLMTHSYVKDLQFLSVLRDERPAYFGVLGPARRREKLFNELLEHHPEISLEYIEGIYGPAGLDLGAETPQEIAITVIAEILAVINQKEAVSLREKEGRIHT